MNANKFVIILLTFGLICMPSVVGLGYQDPFYGSFGQDPYGPYQTLDPELAMPSGEYAAFYTTNRPSEAESLMDLGYTSDVPLSTTAASSAYEPDADMILAQSSMEPQVDGQKGMLLESQGQVGGVGHYGQYVSPNRLWIVDAYRKLQILHQYTPLQLGKRRDHSRSQRTAGDL